MNDKELKQYIDQKLSDLNKGKDMIDLNNKGKLSFGVDSKEFGHLPSWNELVKNKKKMIRLIWIGGFILSLMIVSTTENIWDKLEQNWIKAIVGWISLSIVIMLFYMIWFYYSLFAQFRRTERQIRKLIYEDILTRIEKEEHHLV